MDTTSWPCFRSRTQRQHRNRLVNSNISRRPRRLAPAQGEASTTPSQRQVDFPLATMSRTTQRSSSSRQERRSQVHSSDKSLCQALLASNSRYSNKTQGRYLATTTQLRQMRAKQVISFSRRICLACRKAVIPYSDHLPLLDLVDSLSPNNSSHHSPTLTGKAHLVSTHPLPLHSTLSSNSCSRSQIRPLVVPSTIRTLSNSHNCRRQVSCNTMGSNITSSKRSTNKGSIWNSRVKI